MFSSQTQQDWQQELDQQDRDDAAAWLVIGTKS